MVSNRALLIWSMATLLVCSCSGSNSENQEAKSDLLLVEISKPEYPPTSAESLAANIHFAIQEQDRELLERLFFDQDAKESQLPGSRERLLKDILRTMDQNLIRLVAIRLSDDEIKKRESTNFGIDKPIQLLPKISHEIDFEYEGRLLGTGSRISSVNAGARNGIFYIATYQIVESESIND